MRVEICAGLGLWRQNYEPTGVPLSGGGFQKLHAVLAGTKMTGETHDSLNFFQNSRRQANQCISVVHSRLKVWSQRRSFSFGAINGAGIYKNSHAFNFRIPVKLPCLPSTRYEDTVSFLMNQEIQNQSPS